MSPQDSVPAAQRAAAAWLAAAPPHQDLERAWPPGDAPTRIAEPSTAVAEVATARRRRGRVGPDADQNCAWVPGFGEAAPSAMVGPMAPHRLLSSPAQHLCLAQRSSSTPAHLWWLGAHGGAGESTLAQLVAGSQPGGHLWPGRDKQPSRVVLVARTSAHGLISAQGAVTQWASGVVGGVELLGLVLIADAPGRLPAALHALSKAVAGGAPRVWHLPWIEALRLGADPVSTRQVRAVRRLLCDVDALTTPTNPLPSPSLEEVPDAAHAAARI